MSKPNGDRKLSVRRSCLDWLNSAQQEVLNAINEPVQALTGRPLIANGAPGAAGTGATGGAGGWLIGNGGNAGAGAKANSAGSGGAAGRKGIKRLGLGHTQGHKSC